VLPVGARDLRIIDCSGREMPVPLTEDDAYWTTVAEPIDRIWTKPDGVTRRTPFGRFGLPGVIRGD
jgi:hypothetical protein